MTSGLVWIGNLFLASVVVVSFVLPLSCVTRCLYVWVLTLDLADFPLGVMSAVIACLRFSSVIAVIASGEW